MNQCNNGHLYDETMHSSCPYCSSGNNIGVRPLTPPTDNFPKTTPLNNSVNNANANFPKTEPLNNQKNDDAFPPTQPLNAPAAEPNVKKEMGVTVALNSNTGEAGVNPVRGWLVAVTGEKAGTSFVIHSEKNFIGRNPKFDINLSFDNAVSKDGDAYITFDARNSKFYLNLLQGKNNIYYKGEILLSAVELSDYDTIEIGSTKFVFRSFCNENFTY